MQAHWLRNVGVSEPYIGCGDVSFINRDVLFHLLLSALDCSATSTVCSLFIRFDPHALQSPLGLPLTLGGKYTDPLLSLP